MPGTEGHSTEDTETQSREDHQEKDMPGPQHQRTEVTETEPEDGVLTENMSSPQYQRTEAIETESKGDVVKKNESCDNSPHELSSGALIVHNDYLPTAEADCSALNLPEVILKPERSGSEKNESVEKFDHGKVEEQIADVSSDGMLGASAVELPPDLSQSSQTIHEDRSLLMMDLESLDPLSFITEHSIAPQTEHLEMPVPCETSEIHEASRQPSGLDCEVSAFAGPASSVDSQHIDNLVELDPLYQNMGELTLDSRKQSDTMSNELQTLEANNIMFIPCAAASVNEQGLSTTEPVKNTKSVDDVLHFGVDHVSFQNMARRVGEHIICNTRELKLETKSHIPVISQSSDGVSHRMQDVLSVAELPIKTVKSEQLSEALLLPLADTSESERAPISEPAMNMMSPLTAKQHQTLYFNQELMKNDYFIENFVQVSFTMVAPLHTY